MPDLSRKFSFEENWTYLIFLTILLGISSALFPFYTLLSVFIIFFIFIFFYNINFAFLYMIFILMLQPVIAFNTAILGLPETIKVVVGGVDEIIWFIFFIVILLRKFNSEKWEVTTTNLELPALIFFCVGITSTLINKTSIIWSTISIILALKGIFIYWISKNLKYSANDIIIFYTNLLKFLVVVFIIGLLQYIGVEIPLIPQRFRLGVNIATSIFGHHAIFGFVMAVGFSLATGIYLSTRNKKWTMLVITFLTGIILSSVRKSLLGTLFGVLFVMLNYRRLKINKKDIYASLFALIVFFGSFYSRFSNIIEGTKSEYVSHAEINPRLWLYYGAYKILQKKPFLGEGPGTYGSYISVLKKSKIYAKYGINILDVYKTDTYWPYIMGEYGILGFISIITILLLLFKHLWSLSKINFENKFLKGIFIGYVILFVEYMFESLTMPVYNLSLTTFLLFGGIGILRSVFLTQNNNITIKTV